LFPNLVKRFVSHNWTCISYPVVTSRLMNSSNCMYLLDVSYLNIYTRTIPGRFRVTIIVIWSESLFLRPMTTLTSDVTYTGW